MGTGPSESSKLLTKSKFRGVAERGIPEQVVEIEVRRPRGTPRSFLGLILSSQTDPPTLEHVDLITGILIFLKNQRFRSKDGFESVLGFSRASFGSFWGCLGSSLGPLDRPNRASRFVLEFSWASFARFLLPRMAWGAWVSFFISSRSFLGSILSSQTDPPTVKC